MTAFDERLAAYLSGTLPPDEHAAFEAEVLSSPELADRLYTDVSLRTAIQTAARGRRERDIRAGAAPVRRPWSWRWVVPPLAALAAVAILTWLPAERRAPEVFRGTIEMRAVIPRGDLDEAPAHFVWTSDPGAARYRFELFDVGAAHPVHAVVIEDTAIVLERDSIAIPPMGFWVVTPLDDLGVGAGESITTTYRVTNGSRP